MSNALNNFLHLARRSKSLRYGAPFLDAANSHKIHLILLLSDASANTKKLVTNYGTYYKITVLEINPQTITSFAKLSNAKVISVVNLHIARKLINLRKEGGNDEK